MYVDLILYLIPFCFAVLFLQTFIKVLLARCVNKIIYKEKIIDKEIRNKFYRNCLIAYLLALFGGVIYIVIQLLINSSSDFSSVLDQNVFNFSIILIATPLICLFFDCFTIFRNSELTKTQKIITLIIFVFVTLPFPLLVCSTV